MNAPTMPIANSALRRCEGLRPIHGDSALRRCEGLRPSGFDALTALAVVHETATRKATCRLTWSQCSAYANLIQFGEPMEQGLQLRFTGPLPLQVTT